MKSTELALAFFLVTILSWGESKEQNVEQLQDRQLAASETSNEIWIDVRTPSEFASGHLEDAINIPHTEIGARIGAVVVRKDRAIKLYCRGGGRAGIAQKALAELGYTNLSNEGGYEDILKKTR